MTRSKFVILRSTTTRMDWTVQGFLNNTTIEEAGAWQAKNPGFMVMQICRKDGSYTQQFRQERANLKAANPNTPF